MTPRGIEILVKKASVDGAFRRHLLAERSHAAYRIGLELDSAETAMLDAIPEGQLVAIIGKTKVAPLLRPAFTGYAAAAMLAAVGGFATVSVPVLADDLPKSETETDKTDKPRSSVSVTINSEDNEKTVRKPKVGTGYISGLVTDQNGILVKGALVVVKGANLFAMTDEEGYYIINDIPVGMYDISGSRVGYSDISAKDVKVIEGLGTTIVFTLDSEITKGHFITGIRPAVDKNETKNEREIDERDIEAQTGDDMEDYLKNVPGVTFE